MREEIIERHFSLPLEEMAEHQGKDTFSGPKMSSGGCVSWHRAAIYYPTGGKLPLRAFQECSQLAIRRRSSAPRGCVHSQMKEGVSYINGKEFIRVKEGVIKVEEARRI